MARHVPPHRWAELARGTAAPARARRWQAHAASCERCARARDRVLEAVPRLPALPPDEEPELRWDHIGARIHWVVSSDRRTPRPPRRWWLAAPVLAAVTAAGLLVWTQRDRSSAAAPSVATAPDVTGPPAHVAAPLYGVVTLRSGAVSLGGVPLGASDLVAAEQTIVTGADGRVAVQFGADSGFAVGPESQLWVRRLDDRAVELHVDGAVSVDLAPRRPGQSFRVIAGTHTVTVRGTAFRVEHRDGAVDITCRHGLVTVSDGVAVTDVGAGQRLRIDRLADFAALTPRTIDVDLDRALAIDMTVPMVPAWSGAAAALAQTSMLAVDASPGQSVRVDDVEVARGPFVMRVMAGRHQVAREDARGRVRAVWVQAPARGEVRAPRAEDPATDTAAENAVSQAQRRQAAARARREAIAERRGELRAAIAGERRIDGCLRRLRKQGLGHDAYIVLDIGFGPDGALRHLNIADSNLPTSTAACVRTVVDQMRFDAGPAVDVETRVDL